MTNNIVSNDRCARCGHSKESHADYLHYLLGKYGKCQVLSGGCTCRKFIQSKEQKGNE